jgi:hypothetical protein
MAQNEQTDPSGNTAQFQAFARDSEPAPAKRSSAPTIIGIVVVVVVLAVVAWLALS